MKSFTMDLRKVICAVLAVVMLLGVMGVSAYAEGVPPQVEEGVDETASPAPEESPDPDAALTPPDTEEEMAGTEWEETLLQTGETLPGVEITAVPETETVPETEAVTEPEATPTAAPEETQAEAVSDGSDDPLYAKMNAPMTIAAIPNSFGAVTPRALNSGEVLRKGIDVSAWQGGINWNSVKAAGIDFAFIRVAYRGYKGGGMANDTYYSQNLSGAKNAGLKVGAYFFSQAITPEEAREEARYLVDIVKNYSIDLPLVFDYEEVNSSDRRLKMDNLSRQYKVDICNAFCDEVEAYGYKSMVYSNPRTINDHLDRNQIRRLWLAHFTAKSDYTGAYEYWQFGSGALSGISGEVDLDYWFEPGGKVTPPLNEQVTTPTATPAPTPTPKLDTPPLGSDPFTDVKADSWYAASVQWAYNEGIVSGVGNGAFAPNNTATRGQLTTMLYRMADSPAVTGAAPFTDLKEDYYRDAINWAASKKIVNGVSDISFNPNGKITREDLASMLYRMAGSPAAGGSLSGFTDASSVHEYAKNAMIWAISKGLIKGYDNKTIQPRTAATRAEVCTMLMRYSDLT